MVSAQSDNTLATTAHVAASKRIAIVTVSLSGHLRPAVSVAIEMIQRGYAVDIILGKNGITNTLKELQRQNSLLTVHGLSQGAELIDHVSWSDIASSTKRLFGSKMRLFEEIVRVQSLNLDPGFERLREVIGVLEVTRPDVVIVDHSQMLAREWAEWKGIPTVIMHTPYFMTGAPTGCARMSDEEQSQFMTFLKEANPLGALAAGRAALGIGVSAPVTAAALDETGIESADAINIPEGAANAPDAKGLAPHTLVFCEPELLHEPHVPARVHVVGPCFASDGDGVDEHLLPWLDEAVADGEHVLYVALGTLANGFLTARVIPLLLSAFASFAQHNGWRVLWSLPEAQQLLIDHTEVPSKVRFEKFVRQRAVLGHASVRLFFTHVGQSSVNEGLAAGLPLVCMPLFCDQYELAEAVQKHGLGLVFHKDQLLDADVVGLAAILKRVVEEPMIRTISTRYSHLMRIRGGCRRAGDVIESIVLVGADYQEMWQGLPAQHVKGETPSLGKHALASVASPSRRR